MGKLILIVSLLLSIPLAGCANNKNDVAYRNNNGMQPTRVDYPNRTGVRDVNDTNVNRADLHGNNHTITDNRNNNGTLNNNINEKSRMRVADQAANKIADMREVDTANVIATDNNAYVAVKMAGGKKLTNNIENRISKKVKAIDRDIDNVYVSANPDFYHHMNDYANDIRTGKPVSGFFTEFSQMVQRVFPDVK